MSGYDRSADVDVADSPLRFRPAFSAPTPSSGACLPELSSPTTLAPASSSVVAKCRATMSCSLPRAHAAPWSAANSGVNSNGVNAPDPSSASSGLTAPASTRFECRTMTFAVLMQADSREDRLATALALCATGSNGTYSGAGGSTSGSGDSAFAASSPAWDGAPIASMSA